MFARNSTTVPHCQVLETWGRFLQVSSSSLSVCHTWLSTVGDWAFPVAAGLHELPCHVTSAPSQQVLAVLTPVSAVSFPLYRIACGVTYAISDTLITYFIWQHYSLLFCVWFVAIAISVRVDEMLHWTFIILCTGSVIEMACTVFWPLIISIIRGGDQWDVLM